MTNQIPPLVLAALHQGNKIEAIKIIRAQRGIGLKDAKDVVDAYIRENPALKERMKERKSSAPPVILFVILAAVLIWFFR